MTATPATPIASAVSAEFASRPTLAGVTRQLLADGIRQALPSLTIDLALTQLATPTADGGWSLQPLMPRVLAFLGSGQPLDLSDRYGRVCFLSDQPPIRLKLPEGQALDLRQIEAVILALPWTLPIALQNALADYWRSLRWRWLSDTLLDSLRIAAIGQANLTSADREMLHQLLEYPDRDQRLARFANNTVHAYCPQAILKAPGSMQTVRGPELVLLNGQSNVLLCAPGGDCSRFTSVDAALLAWANQAAQQRVVETITVQRLEPDGDLFDTQAAFLLNHQLQQLSMLKLPATQGLADLEATYRHITDPSYALTTPTSRSEHILASVRDAVPAWLRQAPAAERARYRHYSLQLANAKKRSEGRTFLSDIPDILTFTHTALLKQLTRGETRIDPDDLQLTFSVAAGYPGGAGYVEKVSMSLTDLAISNLQGRPRGQLSISHRDASTLPDWLTADYITASDGLIQQVDIGKTYPELLKTQLLGDSPEIRQREQHFAEHTQAQLPLLALELSLKGEQGFTAAGAVYVAALMGHTSEQRQVNGHAVVIRHLALVRKPQAVADVVTNQYIIEADNGTAGPHILYRPLYEAPLQQFASRQLLLDALATQGELQTSVLTWLSDGARPIYANGGFQEPHYVRFGTGDEFDLPEAPKPAQLADDGVSDELLQYLSNGQLMQYLYGANARALVDQADRDSVSNAESRWQVFLEGVGLIFNTLLLPLARGPLMLAGWLVNLGASATRDIPALESADPVARELAWVDLLLNVGMLMFELPPTAPRPLPVTLDTQWQVLREPLARRRPEQWPHHPAPVIEYGPVLLDAGASALADTVFDFSFSSARQRLTAAQQQRLWQLQAPKPAVLPTPVLNGPRRGLYRNLRDWYALVDSRWYQVRLDSGRVTIVDPFNTQRHGPWLQSDGQGNWSLDLQLRLRGGMPPRRIAAERERKALRKQQLIDEQTRFISGRQEMQQGRAVTLKSTQQVLQDKADIAERLMTLAATDTKYNDQARANTRKNFDAALQEQTAAYQGLLDSRQERSELGIPMPQEVAAAFLENTVNNARKSVVIADMDRQALYADHRDLTAPYEQALPVILRNPPRYAQFLKEVSVINVRQITALELKDRCLLELYTLGQPGLEGYNRLTRNRPDELSALALKDLHLRNLKYLSRKDWRSGLFTNALDLALDPLSRHLRTHSELNLLNFSPEDRVAVLDSLFQQYGQAVDALEGLSLTHADDLNATYFQELKSLVNGLYQDVVQQLAAEVKPPISPAKRPPKRAPSAPGKPQKKVIKTRRQGILIGEVKPACSTLPIEVVEVRSEQENQLLGTYSQHENGWDEVREVPPSAPAQATPATRALNVVKGEARKQLMELQPIIQREEGYAKVSRFPVEIQESLQVEARRFDQIAGELERAAGATPVEADRNLLAELRSAGATLIAKGQELRIQRTLALDPTGSHVAYLLEQNRVQLARLGARVALRGERRDFVQEYAVNDKRGFPLWYAHFHYAKADTPKAEYSVAHLKTRAQRTESYYSLLGKAQSAQGVVDVHRGGISRELAERWFLPLAP